MCKFIILQKNVPQCTCVFDVHAQSIFTVYFFTRIFWHGLFHWHWPFQKKRWDWMKVFFLQKKSIGRLQFDVFLQALCEANPSKIFTFWLFDSQIFLCSVNNVWDLFVLYLQKSKFNNFLLQNQEALLICNLSAIKITTVQLPPVHHHHRHNFFHWYLANLIISQVQPIRFTVHFTAKSFFFLGPYCIIIWKYYVSWELHKIMLRFLNLHVATCGCPCEIDILRQNWKLTTSLQFNRHFDSWWRRFDMLHIFFFWLQFWF